jgi:hypothetical protein
MARIEIDPYEAGKHSRRSAALEDQGDGTQVTVLHTEFGPLSIRLGEPAVEPAAEPAPAKKAAAKR